MLFRCFSSQLTFNPTMVWFYPMNGQVKSKFNVDLSIPLWSDFIQTKLNSSLENSDSFQSHYGLILSLADAKIDKIEIALSIPLWSDFIRKSIKNGLHRRNLSIPLWSDFIPVVRPDVCWECPTFNPTMVWFYLLNVALSINFPSTFNPTMVWFYR